jgi:hypothetical protein
MTLMLRRIHLIENKGYIKPLDGRVHKSGFWDVTPQKAHALVGGDIYFHKRQKELSFFGGEILGYSIHEQDDQYRGRIIFRFEYSSEYRNVSAGDGGWSSEKKIILPA